MILVHLLHDTFVWFKGTKTEAEDAIRYFTNKYGLQATDFETTEVSCEGDFPCLEPVMESKAAPIVAQGD